MVSEDLIIGMELNFLKTKRKKERIKKKKKREERRKRRERRNEETETKEGKMLPVRTRSNFSAKSSVVMYERLCWKRTEKQVHDGEREARNL